MPRLSLETRRKSPLGVSVLFCILKAFPFMIFTLGLRRKIFVSKKTLYSLLRSTVPIGLQSLQRVDRKTALTIDWMVG